MPERIQLRRTKGWRMPEGAVKVDRSTGWGNPYRAVSMGSGWWATLDLDGRLFAQHTSKADGYAWTSPTTGECSGCTYERMFDLPCPVHHKE